MCTEAKMGMNGVELIHQVPIADLNYFGTDTSVD